MGTDSGMNLRMFIGDAEIEGFTNLVVNTNLSMQEGYLPNLTVQVEFEVEYKHLADVLRILGEGMTE